MSHTSSASVERRWRRSRRMSDKVEKLDNEELLMAIAICILPFG